MFIKKQSRTGKDQYHMQTAVSEEIQG